jgi:signal transduction histidine kinase
MLKTSQLSSCKRLGIPFYKCPAFASLLFGTVSVVLILLTQRYADRYLETEVALVTEIVIAAALMFLLFLLVNRLQNNIEKKEQLLQHQSEIEALRNEFTHIASRDIAEASTAMKWGIRTLEPSFEQLPKQDQETLLHIRDRNDHILDIVRNLVQKRNCYHKNTRKHRFNN